MKKGILTFLVAGCSFFAQAQEIVLSDNGNIKNVKTLTYISAKLELSDLQNSQIFDVLNTFEYKAENSIEANKELSAIQKAEIIANMDQQKLEKIKEIIGADKFALLTKQDKNLMFSTN